MRHVTQEVHKYEAGTGTYVALKVRIDDAQWAVAWSRAQHASSRIASRLECAFVHASRRQPDWHTVEGCAPVSLAALPSQPAAPRRCVGCEKRHMMPCNARHTTFSHPIHTCAVRGWSLL